MSVDEQGLLLHSMTLFWEQIQSALDLVQPRRIIEIGSESGGMTAKLTAWAEAAEARVVSIDPEPSPLTRELARRRDHLELLEEASPSALAAVDRAEIYVVDGDHNYWTVTQELEHIFGDPGVPPALAILHDVAWPCARRDQYYAPARLPEDAVHEHSFRGAVSPDSVELVTGGFRGAGAFAYAVRDGGERNGVLTAVDDMCRQRVDLRFMRIPCIFGLGFLFPTGADWREALERGLAPFHESSLLEALERNRVDLYLRVIALQDELENARMRASRILGDWQDRVDDLQAQVLAQSIKDVDQVA